MYKELLDELEKRFNLTKFESSIIMSLKDQDLSADEICDTTNIPKGRIYQFLNNLVDKKLIEKIEKNPALYSTVNFPEKVSDFLDDKLMETRLFEKEAISLLNRTKPEETAIISNSGEYKHNVLKILKESNHVDIIQKNGSIPFIFYPGDRNDHAKIRHNISKTRITFTGEGIESCKFHEGHHELSHSVIINCIADSESMKTYLDICKEYFGTAKFRSFIEKILKCIIRHKMKIKIIDESHPYNLYVSDNYSMLSIIYHKSIMGFSTTAPSIIKIYEGIFNQYYQNGISVQKFIKDNYNISI
jgi:predicted DNA-binding protein YlxM (UPF0122 family)